MRSACSAPRAVLAPIRVDVHIVAVEFHRRGYASLMKRWASAIGKATNKPRPMSTLRCMTVRSWFDGLKASRPLGTNARSAGEVLVSAQVGAGGATEEQLDKHLNQLLGMRDPLRRRVARFLVRPLTRCLTRRPSALSLASGNPTRGARRWATSAAIPRSS